MDFTGKLEELNLTRDEMNRFTEALKDEKFRELLNEYATEISDPENRRRYEEEIIQLEQDRGCSVRFIHPEAHHVLKTRSAGDKCFINICSDRLIDKPSCEAARDPDGRRGVSWRLPYSLTPGRTDRDSGGRACVVYDAVFHPDALHMAERNAGLMKLIHDTAVRGIRDSFRVDIEEDRLKRLKMRYKGAPHPAVIRRPIPGHTRDQNTREDGLAFPYPEPDASTPTRSPAGDGRPPPSTQPTTPRYTLKYRSVVDLQDYRCSRDSGPGARPAQIIIIINLPLLPSTEDTELRVEERRLVLETRTPAHQLEVPLSYPVEEDRGHATFNKTNRQLTVTLQIRPLKTPQLQEMKSSVMPAEDTQETDPKLDGTADESPETEPHARVSAGQLTGDSAPEPQRKGSSTEAQTHGTDNALMQTTEPQDLEHHRHGRSGELDEEEEERVSPGSEGSPTVRDCHTKHTSDGSISLSRCTPQVKSKKPSGVCEDEDHCHPQVEPDSLRDPGFPHLSNTLTDQGSSGERLRPSLPHQPCLSVSDRVPSGHAAERRIHTDTFLNSLCFELD